MLGGWPGGPSTSAGWSGATGQRGCGRSGAESSGASGRHGNGDGSDPWGLRVSETRGAGDARSAVEQRLGPRGRRRPGRCWAERGALWRLGRAQPGMRSGLRKKGGERSGPWGGKQAARWVGPGKGKRRAGPAWKGWAGWAVLLGWAGLAAGLFSSSFLLFQTNSNHTQI